MGVRALVLRTAGTNCDQETAHALKLAGATPEIVHIHPFLAKQRKLGEFQILIIPGGFSYGDDIAAGKILANELRFKLGKELAEFIEQGCVVVGICNGFQVLVKTGLLPGNELGKQTTTLATNDSGRFQCHWTHLEREDSACKWLNETESLWELPIAHGEGKFWPQDDKTLAALEKNKQVVFRYRGANPNGSMHRIAGICNTAGNVIGLMPHPERHVLRTQHPEWTRQEKKQTDPVGLQFFKAMVNYVGRLS